MKKYFTLLSNFIKKFLTHENLIILSSLPFFINWYLVLLFWYEESKLKKQCLRSGVLTLTFFLIMIVSWLFSKFPVIGPLIGNFLHLAAIIFYVGISSFFIYKIYHEEKLEIDVLERQVKNLETILK